MRKQAYIKKNNVTIQILKKTERAPADLHLPRLWLHSHILLLLGRETFFNEILHLSFVEQFIQRW